MATLRDIKIVSINSPWEQVEEQYRGETKNVWVADCTHDSGHGDEDGPFKTQSKKLCDAIESALKAGKPCGVKGYIFRSDDGFGIAAQAKDNEQLVPKNPDFAGGGARGGGGFRSGKGGGGAPKNDRSIVAQVAFKGAIELATAKGGESLKGVNDICRDTEHFYRCLCELSGIEPLAFSDKKPGRATREAEGDDDFPI